VRVEWPLFVGFSVTRKQLLLRNRHQLHICTNVPWLFWLQITNLIDENPGTEFPFTLRYSTTKKSHVLWKRYFIPLCMVIRHWNLTWTSSIEYITSSYVYWNQYLCSVPPQLQSSWISSSKYCSYFLLSYKNYASRAPKYFWFNCPCNMR
jgi:hypothetical protein